MDSPWLSAGGRWESYVFLGALFIFATWETIRPLRPARLSTPRRWLNHGILLAINTALNVFLFRGGTVLFSLLVATSGWGLFQHFPIPYPFRFAIGFAAVDLAHYASHRVYHNVGILWRVHSVHHTDADFDITTGFRFHPLEALLTQSCNFALIALLGPPPLAVLAAEIATIFQNIFEHANIKVPPALDRIVMTPNLHRIHHSVEIEEQNRNFGTIFPWWDQLLGTYATHSSREIETGLADHPAEESLSVLTTLTQPFSHK